MNWCKQLAYFILRMVLFYLSHLVFFFGPAHSRADLPLMDGVAITSCCILIIALFWAVWETLKTVVCRAVQNNKEPEHSSSSSSSSITLVPQIQWDQKVHIRTLMTSSVPQTQHSADETAHNATTVQVTPWGLWYYVYTVGVTVFVLTYSLPGLSALCTLTWIAAATLCTTVLFCEKGSKHVSQLIWTFLMLTILVFLAVDTGMAMHATSHSLFVNIWMGIFLPVGCSLFLLKHSRKLAFIHLSPEEMMAFTLPSLAMMSVSFLSFYVPMQQSTLYTALLNQTSFQTLQDYRDELLLLYSIYYNHTALDLPLTNNVTATNISMSYYYQQAENLMSLFNQNQQHGDYWTQPPYVHYDNAAASIVLTLMCPLILFALILVFLSAFTYESTRVQSNLSAFALAYVLRQCTTQPHHSAWFVRIFALVLALLASALILRNEEWVRAQDVTAAPINLLDDEEEDEDIVYCRQQGATQLIMPHPPTTCA